MAAIAISTAPATAIPTKYILLDRSFMSSSYRQTIPKSNKPASGMRLAAAR
jgi:hypothetical protein